jgi:phosphoglucosamine mutase
MGKLFGTDGIRGKANEYPMTSEIALNVGRAVASLFKKEKGKSKIIIGKDSRISGDMLEYAVASGVCSMGVDAELAGILPTPGIAYLTSASGASAGIVISASHNPYHDNGIKIFDGAGFKLSDKIEGEIERFLLKDSAPSQYQFKANAGRVYHLRDATERYATFLKSIPTHANGFERLKIIIDCSNGATYRVAPRVFTDLEADVESLFDCPDGKNINANCGSEYPETLIEKVLERGADIGLAFDGDGDRLIAIDEKGHVISGDQILAICAKGMRKMGVLKNNTAVSTVMSNMGLGLALKGMGVKHAISTVGDRYLIQKMKAENAVLGAEDSGHMIFLDHHTTGDGILSALKLIDIIIEEGKPLSELATIMTLFPQILVNVDVKRKPDIEDIPQIQDAIQSVEEQLGAKGRVLVRYSGTQSLCRVMIEAPDLDQARQHSQKIAKVIEATLGG